MSRETDLNRAFVEMARTLVNHVDLAEFLHLLCTRCVELFEADAAGLLLADENGHLQVLAASTEQTRVLELLQVQNQEGPCLDCFRTGQPVSEVNFETAERWPQFQSDALAAGFMSVQAVPMQLNDNTIGTLNLFRTTVGRLPDADLDAVQALADVASISILQTEAVREAELVASQLQGALNSRIVIEQAKGIIAEQVDVDVDTAFGLVRSYARNNNLQLTEVARLVTENKLTVRELQSTSGTQGR